jgi:hypothetical protein
MNESIEDWWNHGLSGEDRDEWCSALDTGVISEDMVITLTAEQRRWLVDTTDGSGALSRSMDPDLQAFIAEECSKRLR